MTNFTLARLKVALTLRHELEQAMVTLSIDPIIQHISQLNISEEHLTKQYNTPDPYISTSYLSNQGVYLVCLHSSSIHLKARALDNVKISINRRLVNVQGMKLK